MPASLYQKGLWAGQGRFRGSSGLFGASGEDERMLVKARNEAVRRYHGALTKDAGVQSRLSSREPETQGSGR